MVRARFVGSRGFELGIAPATVAIDAARLAYAGGGDR
jgi:hypothetical protein